MADLTLFKQYLALADQLAIVADKEDLAECARLLAMNVAHYESKFGYLHLDETLGLLDTDTPNQEQADLLARGMETMVGVLGGIVQGFEPKPQH